MFRRPKTAKCPIVRPFVNQWALWDWSGSGDRTMGLPTVFSFLEQSSKMTLRQGHCKKLKQKKKLLDHLSGTA